MGKLIDQFFHAMHTWSQRTTSSDESLRQIVLVNVGRYDEENDTESNLDMVDKRVEVLVEDIHLSERFLIVALIREIERVFEDQLEDAGEGQDARGVVRARAAKGRLMEKATQQERQSPAFQQHLRRFEEFERSIFPTPAKVAQHKLFLDTWREVTRPILQPENLEE